MLAKAINLLALLVLAAACATRAPTDYELDRRAGLVPEPEVERLKEETGRLRPLAPTNKATRVPGRAAPRLEKVWVYDQELDGGYWLQGTYVYLEVEPGRWLEEEAKP